MDETFLKVMLAAQIKFGNETSRALPFELMLTEEVTLETWVLKVFNRLLFVDLEDRNSVQVDTVESAQEGIRNGHTG